jgi:uncharacterized protein
MPDPPRRPVLLGPLLILGVYVPVLGVAVLWSALAGSLDSWLGPPSAWIGDVLLGLGCGLLVVAGSAALVTYSTAYRRLADAMAGIIGPAGWPAVVLAAVASGVAEECLFRGAVQSTLGLVLASLLFAACHLVPDRRFLPWTAFALLAGLGLGALFLWRESLVAPIVAHFTINLINLKMLARRAVKQAPG